ncbi:hypothetical protein ACIQWR_28025 [Streptomyces sp. NPDC098789]|uniref:hypothetical protein n=1 Tax=Streptomyces sp. NPDC098789 TaxID=3366098 RepID=UPI0038271403
MTRFGVWVACCTVLCLGTWITLAGIWYNPGMQHARDSLGGGGKMLAIGLCVPTGITMFSGFLMFAGSPGWSGGRSGGGSDGGHGPGGCGAGCGGGCGGCGGGL